MKIPRDLSGSELAQMLCQHWDYRQVCQHGSHIILETDHPAHHRLAVPKHTSLRIGTLNAILRDVAKRRGVAKEQILEK